MNCTMTKVTRPKQCSRALGFTLIEIMIVVFIIGILLAVAFPNLARARETSREKACIGNLRKIQWAKDAYLMENNLPITAIPNEANLYGPGLYIEVVPECNGGGEYTIGSGADDPTCDYQGGGVHLITGN